MNIKSQTPSHTEKEEDMQTNPTQSKPYRSIDEAVSAAAERFPNRVALHVNGRDYPYDWLHTQAERLALNLHRNGVGPGDRVALFLPRTADLVVAMLAVLKTGAAYVPLDPEYPAERVDQILRDAQTGTLLSLGRLRKRLPETHPKLLCLDEIELEAEAGSRPPRAPQSLALAYVLFTSGSTGRPKGVAIPHGSVLAMLNWATAVFQAQATMLASTSVCFDLSVFEIFLPLTQGGRVVMVDNVLELDAWRDAEVDIINTVPSAMSELLLTNGVPASVSCVNLAGEPLRRSLVDAVYGLAHVQSVYNLYGPSEDTTYSTFERVPRNSEEEPTIGLPIEGTVAHLMDPHLREVPMGELGELCLSGAGLAAGYLGRGGLSAARFVPLDDAHSGARLYRTGDLARRLADGRLVFSGRLDQQVKLRGFRIELGEVETILHQHPDLDEVGVLVREVAAQQQLIAFVHVPTGRSQPEPAQLRRHVAARLPFYMVPSLFCFLETMPHTPNGKLDRKALAALDLRAYLGTGEVPALVGPTEQALAPLVAEVLGMARIGPEDNLFDLGAHSLSAMRITSRIRDLFGLGVMDFNVFTHPTLRQLSAAVEAAQGEHHEHAVIPKYPRELPLPLSFAQERVWFIERLSPGQVAYNTTVTLRFKGRLNTRALERGFSEIIARHEILRTTFREVDHQPEQVIHPAWRLNMTVVDLRGLAPKQREREAARITYGLSRIQFDLHRLPLLQWALCRMDDQDHLLAQVENHVVHDGWSLSVLLGELKALYRAYCLEQPSPLPELEVQFADFAAWERNYMSGENLARGLQWWRERMAGVPPLLEVPTDFPRPAELSFKGGNVRHDLPHHLYQALRAIGTREGITLYATMLSAFLTLLYRYSGITDLFIGSGVANRRMRQIEPLLGMILNNLILRHDLSCSDPDGLSFIQLMRRVRAANFESYGHQDVPFDKIVETLNPVRHPSYAPYGQIFFSFHDSAVPDLDFPGLDTQFHLCHNDSSKFDLNVIVIPRPEQRLGKETVTREDERVEMIWEFSGDLFLRSTIERMIGHYHRLLEALAANPEARINQVDLLDEHERRAILEDFNRTEVAPPDRLCAHERFQQHAAQHPKALAAVHNGQRLSYAQLNGRANQIAHELLAGVRPGQMVAVVMAPCLDWLAAITAVLKVGAAYVPIDPEAPTERINFMIADAAVVRVLCHAQNPPAEQAGTAWTAVPPVYPPPKRLSAVMKRNPEPAVDLDFPAYAIYTSGSTGKPKGVLAVHRGLSNHVAWNHAAFEMSAADRGLKLANVGFDASIWEVWPYLSLGASIAIGDKALATDPDAVLDWILDNEVTMGFVVTPLAEYLMTCTWPDTGPFRLMITGGDRLKHYKPAHLPFALFNGYGPTENTVACTLATVPEAAAQRVLPSIGGPIMNTTAYVLDRRFQPVPRGVPGELILGGRNLTMGYLNRPALTAENFVPDPFAATPGARVYRSGDLVKLSPFGEQAVEFLGRIDFQVKLRGFRIELGEIQYHLKDIDQVGDAQVLIHRGESGEKFLVGYLQTAEGVELDVAAIKAELAQKMPEYMVPTVFVFMDAFPLNASGKVNLRALPAPVMGGADAQGEPPKSRTEKVLATFWGDLLSAVEPARNSNFFDLGGHSLLATRLASRIREELGTRLSLAELFTHAVLKDQAALIERRREEEREDLPPIEALDPAAQSDDIPLSFAQEALWLLEELEIGGPVYNLAIGLRLEGPLDVAALQRAFACLFDHQSSLRTFFPETEEGACQSIEATRRPALDVIELQGLPLDHWRTLSTAQLERPFSIMEPPLTRLNLFRLDPLNHVLLLTQHHICSDGWSLKVLVGELAEAYRSLVARRTPALAPLPVQYADYAAWQRKVLTPRFLKPYLDWWADYLAEVPPFLKLPTDAPYPAEQTNHGDCVLFRFSPEESRQINAYAGRMGATTFMVLQAAFAVLMGRLSGQQKLCLGTPFANRNNEQLSRLFGFFVNMVALRVDLSDYLDHGNFQDLVAQIRDTSLVAFDHGFVPFEKLITHLDPPRDLSRGPLIQVTFTVENTGLSTSAQQQAFPGLQSSMEDIPYHYSKYELGVTVTWVGDCYQVTFRYNTDLFKKETVSAWMNRFKTLALQLPRPGSEAVPTGESAAAEASCADAPLTEAVMDLWAEALGTRPTLADNFFDMGGHSLMGAKLMRGIGRLLGKRHPLRTLFRNPTLGDFLRVITPAGQVAADEPTPKPAPRPEQAGEPAQDAPLSFAQQGLWFVDRQFAGTAPFQIHHPIGLSGPLSAQDLEAAVGVVVGRHDSLRTYFSLDKPRQWVGRATALLTYVDLRGLQPARREAALHEHISADAAKPFALDKAPLARFTLVALPGEHALLTTVHHIISDGLSLRAFHEEMAACYNGRLKGDSPQLPELPQQYAAYAAEERRAFQGERRSEALAWWSDRLAGELPVMTTEHPRPKHRDFRCSRYRTTVSAELAVALEARARRERVTPFQLFLTALEIALCSYTGSEDILVGTPVANREEPVEHLIGLFINLVVLRGDLSGNPSLKTLLARMKQTCMDAFEHGDTPFNELVAELNPPRTDHAPFFQVCFSYSNFSVKATSLAGTHHRDLPLDDTPSDYDLVVTVVDSEPGSGKEKTLVLRYQQALFSPETMTRFGRYLLTVLQALASRPEQALYDLPMFEETLPLTPPARATKPRTAAPLPAPAVGAKPPGTDAPAPPALPAQIPIGRPYSAFKTHVLDTWLHPCPIGIPGEIFIAGPCLSRGYLGQGGLTAQRFIPNPHGRTPGERLYRTGDRALYLENGQIQMKGRLDHQLKIRGFRVEPGETEALLRSDPAVHDALVCPYTTETGEKALVAFVEALPGRPIAAEPLLDGLRRRLPPYQVPERLELCTLPLTPNGKLDRRALIQRAETLTDPAPPPAPKTATGDTAARLIVLWREILKRDTVKADDHFFMLGGHSLSALTLTAAVRSEFELDLPLQILFEKPVLADLAQYIDQAVGTDTSKKKTTEPSLGLTLSPGQKTLWFLEHFEGISGGRARLGGNYNVWLRLLLSGSLSVQALAQALDGLMGRHDLLRTNYPHREGQPYAVVQDNQGFDLTVLDVGGLTVAETQPILQQLKSRPFHLGRDRLMRPLLLRRDGEHQFVLTLHHINTDGWSIGLMARELLQGYQALLRGTRWDPPKPSPCFADYVAWIEDQERAGTFQELRRWWRETLAEVPSQLDLNTDFPRPARQHFEGEMITFALPDPLWAAIQMRAGTMAVTPFMQLQAVFAALLARYSGMHRFNLGTPSAGREEAQFREVVGYLVNTVVLPQNLEGAPDFTTLLNRTRTQTLACMARQLLPLDQVIACADLERHPGRPPLFQALFAVQNLEQPEMALPLLRCVPQAQEDHNMVKYELELVFVLRAGKMEGRLLFSRALWRRTTMTRLVAHFLNLLAGASAAPDTSIFKVPLLSEGERHHLLTLAHGPQPAPTELLVHQRIEEIARLRPSSPALWADTTPVRFQTLDRSANHLAAQLAAEGVTPGRVVALCLPPTPLLVLAQLAVLKAGAAFLPLDPQAPPKRCQYMLQAADAQLLITDDRSKLNHPRQLRLSEAHWQRQSTAGISLSLPAAAPAYLVFTSGSTGRPKAVVIPHGALRNLVAWHERTFAAGPSDRIAKLFNVAFDASNIEIWPYLSCGAALVFPPTEVVAHAGRLHTWLNTARITHAYVPTALAEALLTQARPGDTSLKHLFTGGDRLTLYPPPNLPFQFHNQYGPSETTVLVTSHRVDPEAEPGWAPVLGGPIDACGLYLADAHLQLVPEGVSGELLIGGSCVGSGYWRRPGKTAELFVPDPFGGTEGGRLYKSGDRMCLRGGKLAFLSRLDRQLSLRGLRIEPGEITAHLKAMPALEDAYVDKHTAPSGEPHLIAYLCAQTRPTDQEVRDWLQERLPAYMIPTHFLWLQQLPTTRNGKLDPKALPQPQWQTTVPVAPRTENEHKIAALWSSLLGIETPSVHDDFFKLGGNSLLSVRLQAALEQSFDQPFPLAQLFERATIAGQAAGLTQPYPYTPLVLLNQGGGKPPLFLVHAVGGTVFPYRALAQQITDRPVYAFMAAGLNGRRAPFEDLNTMVTTYLQVILEKHPEGPVQLGGWSVGGAIAMVLQQRLSERGFETGALLLLDSWAPTRQFKDTFPTTPTDEARAFLGEMGAAEGSPTFHETDPANILEALVAHIEQLGLMPDPDPKRIGPLFEVFRHMLRALDRYPFTPSPAKGILFRAEGYRNLALPPNLRWDQMLAGIEEEWVPGKHMTLLQEPNVTKLAQTLKPRLLP